MTAETWETDGSRDAERSTFLNQINGLQEEIRRLNAILDGARYIAEQIDLAAEEGERIKLLQGTRDLRIILTRGNANAMTPQADLLVERWLQDPHRSIFGLAADLLDVLGPVTR